MSSSRGSALLLALTSSVALVMIGACSDPRGEPDDAGPGVDGGVTTPPPPPGPCRPFDIRACYGGPAGTRNVGQCREGRQECLPTGIGYGPCQGEVLPIEEDCTGTLGDEDCDGEINESGPSCVCPGGQWEPCYDGPSETRGVGACRDGQRFCDDLGLSWSGCSAATTPAPEDCLRPFDEDCDGDAAACPTDFAITFGDVSTGASEDGEWVNAVAAGPDGDFVVGGVAVGAFELGGVRYANPGGPNRFNGFVARFDETGTVEWVRRFPDSGRSEVTAVAIGPSGDVAIGGSMGGTVDFGGGARSGVGHFVVVLAADGTHRYSFAYSGGDDDDYVSDVAIDAAGNLYYTARISHGVDVGGGATDGTASLVSLDATGAHRFDVGFNAQGTRMALSAAGVAVAGDQGAATANDFGDGEVYGDFVLSFGLDGALRWAQILDRYLDTADVTIAADGTVYAIGSTSQFADLAALPVVGDEGDLFLLEVAPDGTPRAMRLFGSGVQGPVDYGGPHDLELTSEGELFVLGSFDGAIDLGSGPMPNVAQEDHFVALIETDTSAVRWLQRFGTPAREWHGSLHGTTDPSGAILLGGRVLEPIDLGTGTLTSRGFLDALVARVSP